MAGRWIQECSSLRPSPGRIHGRHCGSNFLLVGQAHRKLPLYVKLWGTDHRIVALVFLCHLPVEMTPCVVEDEDIPDHLPQSFSNFDVYQHISSINFFPVRGFPSRPLKCLALFATNPSPSVRDYHLEPYLQMRGVCICGVP